MSEPRSYPPPLDRLFTLGRASLEAGAETLNYVAELGLTHQHVPALIEIARLWEDYENLPEDATSYASVHAWRALGQLRAIEAVEPLLNMQNKLSQENDDWYPEEFPAVFANIGPAAIPSLASYLADKLNREFSRVSAAGCLSRIAQKHPESRDEVVRRLIDQLARNEEGVYDLNGLIICYLLDLKATEAAEAIERAFAANVVDETICGSWGDVRKELGVPGLGLAPDTPPRPHFDRFPHFSDSLISDSGSDRDRQRKAEKKAKTKRKLQEKTRKRNRKRR